jgi:hypothetical protein
MTPTPVGEYIVKEGAKASPTLAVSGMALFHIQLQEWVYILTITYTLLQIGWFLWSKLRHLLRK